MFSHHSNLAQVWEHLQGRHDIASLVREIIGQHSIDTSLLERDNRTIQEKFRAIGWIKTIFDSQRCYLTGLSTGVAACPPYILSCLLSPPLLLSTLMYLIHVKTDLFSSRTTLITRDLTRPRLVLAQTILSGFRLLLLHKEPLATNDLRRLQEAISQAWRDDRLFGAERFIVSDLFAEALNALEDPTRANPYQRERANAKLPMYAMGLVSCTRFLRVRSTFGLNHILGLLMRVWKRRWGAHLYLHFRLEDDPGYILCTALILPILCAERNDGVTYLQP